MGELLGCWALFVLLIQIIEKPGDYAKTLVLRIKNVMAVGQKWHANLPDDQRSKACYHVMIRTFEVCHISSKRR